MAPGTGSISGTITWPDTPVTSLTPMVSVIDTFGWEVAHPDCDDSGAYSVTGLYPGAYLVMTYREYDAKYSGDSSAITYLGNTTSIGAARWIHLTSGQSLAGQDIAISSKIPSSQPKIIVSGICYEGSGTAKPLTAATVTVTIAPVDNNSLFLPTKSDYCRTASDGAFACTLAASPGSYYGLIEATRNDTSFVPQWLDGSAITSQPVAVSLGPLTTGKEIYFSKGGSISGVVVDEISDTLLEYVYVHALDKDGYDFGSAYCSDFYHDSTFFIGGLPEGSWYIKVTSSFSSPYGTTYYPQAGSLDAATAVSVTVGNSTQVRITLKRQNSGNSDTGPKGHITGRITRQDNSAPLPDYSVQFSPGSFLSYSSGNATTDSLGNYYDSLHADSSYYVYSGDEMLLSNSTSEYYLTTTWYPGVTAQSAAEKVKVAKGSTKTVDIAVQQGGSIGGWIHTPAGTKLPDYLQGIYHSADIAYGYAWNDDFSNVYTTFIGENSGFRFCGVSPGSYTVRFLSLNISNRGIGDISESTHSYVTARDIAVTKENTAFNRILTIPDGNATITGTAEISLQSPDLMVSLIYCYAEDSILAGYSANTSFGNTISVKDLFFSREVPSPVPAAQVDYSIGKLVPGKYALARVLIDTLQVEISRQWYGTTTWEKFNLDVLNEYYHQFLKPNIPSTSWITLAAGETRSGVNFGNIGTLSPAKSNRAANAELRLLHGTLRNINMYYSLPEFDGSKPAILAIYTSGGALIKTIRLDKPKGIITWDGKSGGNTSVSSGVYIYRLTGAGRVVTAKGAWVQ